MTSASRNKPLEFKGISKSIEFEYIESGELGVEMTRGDGTVIYMYLSPEDVQKFKEWLI